MNIPENKTPNQDSIFSLEEIFPDAAGIFFKEFEKLDNCTKSALVVLDTNVLLMPYSLGNQSISEIRAIYEQLIKKGQLYIPERAAREFAKNKTAKIAEIYSSIQKRKTGKTKSNLNYPLISDLEERKIADSALEALKEAEERYFKSIDSLLDKIRNWEWDDPVNSMYSALFRPENFCTHKIEAEELAKDLKKRSNLKIPPGYKDSSKDDGGIGDLAIWHSILELGRSKMQHVIFVSEETKPDWWQNANGAEFLPRLELIDEYRRASNGKSLHIIKLSKLLEIYKASEAAIKEAQGVEKTNKITLEDLKSRIESMKKKHYSTSKKSSILKERMIAWFRENYTDPAEICPYESAEGGYEYIWGGPYDAYEELESKFGGTVPDKLIAEVAGELTSLCWEWSGIPRDESINIDDDIL